jgi:hypothetical protein
LSSNNRFLLLKIRPTSRLIYAPLLVALGYVCLVSMTGADLDARIRGLRYWSLLAMAVFAIAAPHILLPDRDLPLLQRLNRTPSGLLKHQLKMWQPVALLFVVPVLLLAFWDPSQFTRDLGSKTLHATATILLLLGTATYSFLRYVRIGPVSQAWQEGKKGDWYRTMKENSPGGFAVPEGLVPAMLVTQKVFAVGILALVASAYMGQSVNPLLAPLPAAVLFGWSVMLLGRGRRTHDHAYYSTNAFYGEVFRSAGGVRVSAREAVPYKAVYWSPARYKPHLWAALRQLDRKLPLGRMMAVAHALLWLLFYIDASAQTITAFLLLLITAKNAASYVLTQPAFAPMPFNLGRQSDRGWIITRFLVNLRWTFPLLLSLLIVATLDASLPFSHALGWTALDVVAGFSTAFLFTLLTEYRYRRRLA